MWWLPCHERNYGGIGEVVVGMELQTTIYDELGSVFMLNKLQSGSMHSNDQNLVSLSNNSNARLSLRLSAFLQGDALDFYLTKVTIILNEALGLGKARKCSHRCLLS